MATQDSLPLSPHFADNIQQTLGSAIQDQYLKVWGSGDGRSLRVIHTGITEDVTKISRQVSTAIEEVVSETSQSRSEEGHA